MQVTGITHPVLLLPSSRPGPAVAAALGRVLDVTVLAATRAGPGPVLLELGGRPVSARSELPLTAGEVLRVRVEADGAQPVLRVLSRAASSAEARALRDALPRQGSLAAPLAGLEALRAASGRAPRSEISAGLRQAFDRYAEAVPDRRQVTSPGGLARAIADSGLFLESKLADPARFLAALAAETRPREDPARARNEPGAGARGPAPAPVRPYGSAASVPGDAAAPLLLARDLKSLLLGLKVRLAAEIGDLLGREPSPARGAVPGGTGTADTPVRGPVADAVLRAAASTEGALAKLVVNQVQSLHAGGAGEAAGHVWHLELPVRSDGRTDVVELEIERDGDAGEPLGRWTVVLSLDLDELGPIQARVQLVREAVTATLWAERPATASLVGARLDRLTERLEAAGLVVGNLSCHEGPMPGREAPRPRPSLVHLRA